MDDFEQSLRNAGATSKHADTVAGRVPRVLGECRFTMRMDVTATAVQNCLASMQITKGKTTNPLSAQTRNHYLGACQQFARWMIQNRRAMESPIAHLKRLNVKPALEHEPTAFEIEEIRRLLAPTAKGPERYGMDGRERAFFAGKMPGVKAFGGRYVRLTDRTSDMLQEDLEATAEKDDRGNVVLEAVPYTDAVGRYLDFHSLRHTRGSWLADCGVHLKQIQEIARHSDINLTMTRYGHSLRGREAEAVAKLPDLSLSACEVKRATGTDDGHANGKNDLARDLALLVAPSCTTLQASAQTTRVGDGENGVLTASGGTRTPNHRFRRPMLYPIELRTLVRGESLGLRRRMPARPARPCSGW